jgi:hypothetical protein
MKGASFDRSRIRELKGPTFLINWWQKEEGEDIIYTTGGWDNIDQYTEKGLFPVWSVDQVWFEPDGSMSNFAQGPEVDQVFQDPRNRRMVFYHKLNHPNPSSGSGLASAVGLCKLAKEVNIYGWDHYLAFEPGASNYWKVLLGMLSFPTTYPGTRAQPDVVEMAIYGWHYAHRISQLPFVKVHSYLGQLGHHPKLVKKLEKVFYEV